MSLQPNFFRRLIILDTLVIGVCAESPGTLGDCNAVNVIDIIEYDVLKPCPRKIIFNLVASLVHVANFTTGTEQPDSPPPGLRNCTYRNKSRASDPA